MTQNAKTQKNANKFFEQKCKKQKWKYLHDSLTTFMPFESISQDFLKTCEMS